MKVPFAALIVALALPASAEIRVIDGDTIDIGGEVHRINGIDAPEYGQKCAKASGKDWPCGKEATALMADLALDRQVRCEVETTDRYGRSISTCYADGTDIGAEMVRRGMAWAFVRYSDAYVGEEREARKAGSGIWQGEATPAWDYRAMEWQRAETGLPEEAPKGCVIKGNISDNGMIYHAPWSPWYSRTKINTAKGERWFCDEAEAVAAGWRAPYWW